MDIVNAWAYDGAMNGWISSNTGAVVAARQAELRQAGRQGHRLPVTSRRAPRRSGRRGRPAVLRLAGELLIGTGRWLGGAEADPGRGRLASSCS